MAPTLLSAAGFLCLLCVVSANFQPEFYEPQRNVGFDQSLSYSGSSGSPGSGSGSVPTVPDPSYGGSPTPSGSGSVPSGSGGGYGSVPSTDPTYGGGSGGGSVPSVDPSGPTGPGIGGTPGGSGGGSVPSVDPSGPTGPGIGGTPGGSGPGGFPTVPSTGGSPMPSGGCSCDFWATHVNSWPDPLQLISTVSAIFGGLASNTFGPNVSLLSALQNTRPDPYSQLLRQGTAAMLNSYAHPHFAYTPVAVRTHFNAALVSPHAAAVQATKFANANRGYGTSTICT